MTQLEKIEQLLEYSYLSNNYLHLHQVLSQKSEQLKRSIGNILLMAEIERVKKDMEALSKRMTTLQTGLLKNFEKENETELHYLIKRGINGEKQV